MSGYSAAFNPGAFGPVFGPLLAIERTPALGPGRPEESQRGALEQAAKSGFGHLKISRPDAAAAVMAGMWLLFDFLDESHELSQSLSDEWGAYWHGIMHRREPDPGNATYWFRRIGENHFQASLRAAALDVGYAYRDPFQFVKDCEQYRGTGGEQERRLVAVQLAEIRLLLRRHFEAAIAER